MTIKDAEKTYNQIYEITGSIEMKDPGTWYLHFDSSMIQSSHDWV